MNGASSAFMKALGDVLPGLSNAGREALLDRVSLVDSDGLVKQWHTRPSVPVRKNILRLLARLGKWASLPHLIRATCAADAAIVQMATRYLQRWVRSFNRDFTTPTAAHLAEIRVAVTDCPSGLGEEERRMIQSLLKE